MYFMRRVKIYRRRATFAPILASAMDGLSNLSKRKLGRRDATGFKKLPHPDDFLLWQIAMSVRECSGTSIEDHTDSIAGLILHLCPQVFQEMYDLFEINIRAERVSE
jgi:hypothetical protein